MNNLKMLIIKSKEEIDKAFSQFKTLKPYEQTLNKFAFLLSLSMNNYWSLYNQCLRNANNETNQYFINIHQLVITLINSNVESKMLFRSEKVAMSWMKKNNGYFYNFKDDEDKKEDITIQVVNQSFKENS